MGTCSIFGHHENSGHSSHHQHAQHSHEEHTNQNNCDGECTCQQVANIRFDTSIVSEAISVIHWSIDQVATGEFVRKVTGYALARDGPLFEQARNYARETVVRT